MFDLDYHPAVVSKDIPKLSADWKIKIRHIIEERLAVQPDLYSKPLRRNLKSHRKLRVGDYRVVFRIEGKTVKVLAIGHRSTIYKQLVERL